MGRFVTSVLFLLALVLLSGCSSLPVPEPLSGSSSGIGIAVKNRAPIRLFGNRPDRIYFVKLDDGSNATAATRVLPSNYARGKYVYLLNAQPGRYAAVASFRRQVVLGAPTSKYSVYFSEELIKVTEITVHPAEMSFMGEFVVDTSLGLKKADKTQLHYHGLIGSGDPQGWLMSLDYAYRGSMHKSARNQELEAKFLAAAQKHLGAGGWSDIINHGQARVNARK